MRTSFLLSATVAGALFSLPALAQHNLAGTTWADDDCMIAIEFHTDYSFLQYVLWDEYAGHWRLDGDSLTLQYDNGDNVQATISNDMFAVTYQYSNEDPYTCYFVPD